MLRLLLVLLCSYLALPAFAQWPLQRPRNPDYPGAYESRFLRRSSLTATIGSGWVQGGFDRLGHAGWGEISYAFAVTRALDVGAGVYGSLLCNRAYYDDLGVLITPPDDPKGDNCDRAWAFGQTFMAFARYYPLRGWPAFAQAGGGWSVDGEGPVALLGVGYQYRIIERIAVAGLIRYAALIPSSQTPDWAQKPGGLRVELGLIWHHLDL